MPSLWVARLGIVVGSRYPETAGRRGRRRRATRSGDAGCRRFIRPYLTFLSLRARLRKVAFCLPRPSSWRALWRGVAPTLEHRQVVEQLDYDLVLDIGANKGQFSLLVRLIRPGVPIHAYEPHGPEATVLKDILGTDALVSLHQIAIGERDGLAELHVSRRPDSSSLLAIGNEQTTHFPGTEETGVQTVEIRRLDSLPSHWKEASRALIKIDVQGYELRVLEGASSALANCRWVYVECSEVELYEGQALFGEVSAMLATKGFRLIERYNAYRPAGRVVQADYLFAKVPA